MLTKLSFVAVAVVAFFLESSHGCKESQMVFGGSVGRPLKGKCRGILSFILSFVVI